MVSRGPGTHGRRMPGQAMTELLICATFLLIPLFLLHTVSMLVPYKMPALIRGRAKSATAVGAVNAVLIAAWLIPSATLFIAAAFVLTYLYSFIVEGARWLRGRENET